MSVFIETDASGWMSIRITDRFDFNAHTEFRRTYSEGTVCAGYVIDLSRTTFIDSAALGMLLVLREHVGDDPARLVVKGASGQPLEVLKVAHFERLFSVAA